MPENRKYLRQRVALPVAYQTADGVRVEATCSDVSLGGMFVETASPLSFGTPVKILVRLPGTKTETVLNAVVRWTTPNGMGVQFGSMGARETHALTELLAAQ